VTSLKTSNIFNYDFDWFSPDKTISNSDVKEKCCKKYKKKAEKKCKNCPKEVQ